MSRPGTAGPCRRGGRDVADGPRGAILLLPHRPGDVRGIATGSGGDAACFAALDLRRLRLHQDRQASEGAGAAGTGSAPR